MSNKKTLTIGLISPYALISGGVQNHILELKEELMKQGHKVYLFVPKLDNEIPLDETTIYIGKAVLFYFEGTSTSPGIWPENGEKVKKFLKTISFDVLHFHSPLISPTTWQMLSYADTAIVTTFHETKEKVRLWHQIARIPASLFCNKTHKTIAISNSCAETVSEFLNKDFTIIPCGINTRRFSPKGKTLPWFDKTIPTILFLGRLEHRKGILELLEAYPIIKREIPSAKLVIAGKGLLEEEIRKTIKRNHLKDIQLTGFAPEDEKDTYYRSCHVFCAPATYNESLGIVLLEAMASGCPIVAAANKGYKELLSHGEEAFLVPPKNPAELAYAIVRLLKDKKRRKIMREKGQKKAEQYDWQTILPRITNVYHESILSHQIQKKSGAKGQNNSAFAKLWEQVADTVKSIEEWEK